MKVEVIVNREKNREGAGKDIVKLIELCFQNANLHEIECLTTRHYYTGSEKVADEALNAHPDASGRNIYLEVYLINPQEFYRDMSKEGFVLVDSRISPLSK